jgi:death-associated protein 6
MKKRRRREEVCKRNILLVSVLLSMSHLLRIFPSSSYSSFLCSNIHHPSPHAIPLFSSFPGDSGDNSPMSTPQISTEKNLEPDKRISRSSGEHQNKGLTVSPASLLEEPRDPSSTDAESTGEQFEELPLEEESPESQLFELEIEALPVDTTPSPEERDISSSRKQSEDPLTTVLENGASMVTSTSFNGGVSPHTWRDSSPPCKKPRKEKQTGSGPLGNG